ncbi:MAG: transglutaminase domain-containing protein [Erysipelotrichia bacterium]|nr:transglutaminase domain-containing protein [Erysipelotrichia bacterium]
MHKKMMRTTRIFFPALGLLFCFICCSCTASLPAASADSTALANPRTAITDPPMPEQSGILVLDAKNGSCSIDYSNTSEGYIFVTYTGSAAKVQIQITEPDGKVYPYPLNLGTAEPFPLTGGNGDYQVNVFEQISGSNYAVVMSGSFAVQLNDEFRPYLYPSQYISYTKDSQSVKLGIELSKQSADDLDYIGNVYDYVTSKISYDKDLAADPPTDYIPNPDSTLSLGTGICFDYASLMTAMLRSQGIPTKLQVGYTSNVYHAWISVYLNETGWIDGLIRFENSDWTLMDPTLGSYTSEADVADYTKDSSNYYVMYNY